MICKSPPDVCNLDSQCPLHSSESCMATAFQHLRHDYIKSKKSCRETIAELGVPTNWKHEKRKYQRFKVHDNWRCSIILPFSRQFPSPNPLGASWRAGEWEGEAGRRPRETCEDGSIEAPSEATWMQDVWCTTWTYMVKRETTPMIVWADFQWRFVPGGWNMTKNRLGVWLEEPMCFFLVGMRSSGTSIRKQAGLLIAGRTSLT